MYFYASEESAIQSILDRVAPVYLLVKVALGIGVFSVTYNLNLTMNYAPIHQLYKENIRERVYRSGFPYEP